MADITQITSYTGRYSGLLNNFYVTIAIAGVCLIGYEIEVHIPRRRGRDGTFKRIHVRIGLAAKRAWSRWTKGRIKQKQRGNHIDLKALVGENGGAAQVSAEERARRRLGSRESWEFGYMHQPKAWRLDPSPPVSRWPLAWVVSSLKVRERDMPETCGLDLTLHARFLRGCFFYSCLQAIIVLPILMPLHIFYSPDNISSTSMTRASVSSLVQSSGQRWLWVHAVLVWWMTLTWLATALWIIWGGLAYRKREVRRLAERTRQSREKLREQQGGEVGAGPAGQSEAWSVGDECEGIKRFRTVMITNVPPDMRDEATLRDYFDHYIHRHRVRSGHVTQQINAPNAPPEGKEDTALQRIAFSPKRLLRTKAAKANNIEDREEEIVKSVGQSTMEECDDFESEVDEVILVRKLGRLVNLRDRRNAVLRQLEVAHVKLAQRVLEAVAKYKEKHPDKDGARIVIHPVHDLEKGVLGFNASRDEALPPHLSKEERMDRLVSALGTFVGDEPDQLGKGEETVWDVLHALPRELLDPYQSLTHLTSLFRDQNAPLIDYLSTKLSYLTLLLDEARSRPLSSFDASSTAFVTFRDARTCRLALKILDSHPKRSLACHTTPAPDWTNLLWARLGKSVYRSEFVRGWAVYFGVWAFTLVWIFPVSFLCALSSLDNLAAFLPALADYLQRNPNTARFVTSLVPVILVAGLTIAICPILLLIANRAETIVTRLGIHNSVLERFWNFLMVNGVVFFAIGQAAIQSYLNAFRNRNFDPLPVVASAFPSAAPYFASYVLLQTAIQPCFELFRFGLAHIVYVFGTRVSTIPRQRNSRTEYPTFSHFSQLPYQLLAGAIMHLFMILNPLVIPFCLIYYATCYLVWKRQFTYVYGRLYENNGRRSSVRILRYSLDAVALAQFVLFAFFILNKAKGHAISTGILFFLTLFAKLIITRAIKRRHDNLDIEESDILCPPVLREQDSTNAGQGEDTLDDWVSVDYPNHSRAGSTKSGRFSTFKHDISTWVGKWGYASHGTPAGHRKPIPFEHVLFATLDSKISFDDDKQSTVPPLRATIPDTDAEMVHKPDHPIIHEPAPKIVVPHHAIRAWEDIPPYQRSRGYHDQPAYTDDYDDFLWLPRDPLSTLDLDDTVEMRLALTTSAGGAGTIGDWPPIEFVDHPEEEVAVQEEAWQEVMIKRRSHSPETPDRPSRTMSPSSEKRLIEPIELSPFIGSEVDHGPGSGLIRRGTRRVGEGLTSLFRRPRSDTHHTDDSDFGISMRTLSSSSASREDRASLPSAFTTRAEGLGIATSDGDILARPPMTAPLVGSSRISITRPKATHGGSFSSARLTSSSDSGSPFLLPVRTSTPRLMQTEELVGNDQIERLDLASPASTVVSGEPGAASRPVDASTLQRERSSQLTIQLGRSPSGRRPMGLPASVRLRSGSRTSTTLSFAEDPHPPRSPRLAVDPKSPTRSATSIMARSRSMRAGRDRSFSLLNAQQQALMSEVMKEEQIAAAEDRKEERVERMKDEEALMRERGQGLSSASTRRLSTRTKADSDGASDVVSGPPTLSRGVSKMSTASRGLSIRGKFERSGSSNTTATIQTTATGSGPAPPPTVQVEGPIEDLTPKALATLPNTDV